MTGEEGDPKNWMGPSRLMSSKSSISRSFWECMVSLLCGVTEVVGLWATEVVLFLLLKDNNSSLAGRWYKDPSPVRQCRTFSGPTPTIPADPQAYPTSVGVGWGAGYRRTGNRQSLDPGTSRQVNEVWWPTHCSFPRLQMDILSNWQN